MKVPVKPAGTQTGGLGSLHPLIFGFNPRPLTKGVGNLTSLCNFCLDSSIYNSLKKEDDIAMDKDEAIEKMLAIIMKVADCGEFHGRSALIKEGEHLLDLIVNYKPETQYYHSILFKAKSLLIRMKDAKKRSSAASFP